jgi:hypothetical protein
MSDKGVFAILTRAIALLCSDATYRPQVSNCWLPAATWVEALRRTGYIDASIVINVRKFNSTMSKSSLFGSMMTRFDGSNPTGVFRINFQHDFYYFFTDKLRQEVYPRPLNRAWKERVLKSAANVLAIPSIRARPSTVENTPVQTKTTDVSDSNADSNDNENESPNMRQRINSVAGTCSYWPASPKAYQLFRPAKSNNGGGNSNSSSESPQEALKAGSVNCSLFTRAKIAGVVW